jgi:hypothetical protein
MAPQEMANARRQQPGTRLIIAPADVGRKRLMGGVSTRYSRGMKLAPELPPAPAERLRQEARRLGLAPEDLARAAVLDLLSTPDVGGAK